MAERFTIEKNLRRAQRGPSDWVHDGWVLTDNVLGPSRRYDTKHEANSSRLRTLGREESLRRIFATVEPTGWSSHDDDNARNGYLREVYIVVPVGTEEATHSLGGQPTFYGGLCALRSIEADVAAVLAVLDLPADLPRWVR